MVACCKIIVTRIFVGGTAWQLLGVQTVTSGQVHNLSEYLISACDTYDFSVAQNGIFGSNCLLHVLQAEVVQTECHCVKRLY